MILMYKVRNFLLRNWLSISIGCILTKYAVEFAYMERGYVAVGSEWFVMPMVMFIAYLIKGFMKRCMEV